MNFVMTEGGRFVEIQGTAERKPFDQGALNTMIEAVRAGADRLFAAQRDVLKMGR